MQQIEKSASADDPPEVVYKTTLEVATTARVQSQTVTRDLRQGTIQGTRIGRDWAFTPGQYRDALAFYRRQRRARRHAPTAHER